MEIGQIYTDHDGLLSDCEFPTSVHIDDIQHAHLLEAWTNLHNESNAMQQTSTVNEQSNRATSEDTAIAECRWYASLDGTRGIKLTLDGIAGAPGWVLSHDTLHSSAVHHRKLVPLCPCRRYVLHIQQATRHHLKTRPQCR